MCQSTRAIKNVLSDEWWGLLGFVLVCFLARRNCGCCGASLMSRFYASDSAQSLSIILFTDIFVVFTARRLDGAASMGFRTTSFAPSGRILCLFIATLPELILGHDLSSIWIFQYLNRGVALFGGHPAQH